MELTDKISEGQILGCLMVSPLFLSEVDKYHLEIRDFSSKFNRIIFSAINNIFLDGAKTITPIEVDNYLNNYPELKNDFDKNNGITFLNEVIDLSQLENFPFYYSRVKKFSCLRALEKDGFPIEDIVPKNVLDKNYSQKMEEFENLSVQDIFDKIKTKFFSLEESYQAGATNNSGFAADNLRELKESFKIMPEIGFPLQGKFYNSIAKGARKGKYYLRSAGTGVGKTRMAVGDACNLAFPIFFDWETKSWIQREGFEKSLFITTELAIDEIQTLIISWMSGVNENKIITNNLTFEEEAIVDKAIDYIMLYKDNFIIQHIPDPSINQIESVIRKEVLINKVKNVFYDYIFSSPSLLNEFKSLKIREDVVLCMLSTALKDLAVELNIFMGSSTQISGDIEAKKGIRNQSFIRGAKSIADKADVGCITVAIPKEEEEIISPLINKFNLKMPNIVTDIYKVRRSPYKNVKIWSRVDLGTCRVEDILVTDGYYNPISNFETLEYDFRDSKIEEEENKATEEITQPQETTKRKLSDVFC